MEQTMGRRIRLLREQAGLTQEEVAEELSVSRQAVSKWEADLSRPSSENLIRLSHLFKVELTEIIGTPEEEGAAEEAPPPRRSEKRRRWPWVVAAVLVVLAALSGSPLKALLFMVNLEQEGPGNVSVSAEVVETELPLSLALAASDYYQFEPYTNYGTAADGETVEAGLLFQYRWPYTNTTVAFYRQPSATDGGLYHLYAAYTLDGSSYTVIARIVEDQSDAGAPSLSLFGALGWLGCKVETHQGPDTSTFFFGLDAEGTPRLLYMTPGKTVEWDIDGDGEEEMAFLDHPEGILFIDREVEDYTAYTLAQALPEGAELKAEDGAFQLHVPRQGGQSFVYFWNGELLPVGYDEVTSFDVTAIEAPVNDTVITFLRQDWTRTEAPDAPYGWRGSGMPTDREFSYIALQTLYDLTGQRVERCYAWASDNGVSFSLDKNTNHCFFSFGRTEKWSGNARAVGGVEYIAWHSENNDWSPIRPIEAGDAQWVYDHVPLLQDGPIVETSFGLGSDVRLHLENGSFYEVSFDGPEGLPTRIQGVYPAGFEH